MVCYEETPLNERGEPSATQARGCNSRYLFFVNRSQEMSPWLLNGAMSNQAIIKPTKHPRFRAEQLGPLGHLERAWMLCAKPLSDLLDDPRFTLKELREVELNAKQCVRLEFTYRPEENARRDLKTITQGGFVIFDPERDWSIQQYEERGPQKLRAKGELAYQKMPDGSYLVERSSLLNLEGDKLGSSYKFQFDRLVAREIPESEFTLSAFGLPEVTAYRERGHRQSLVWMWLIVGGGLLLAASIAVLRRIKRPKISDN